MRKVLFFGHVSTLGGAGLCLYHLIEKVRGSAEPVVVLSAEGPLVDMFRSEGVQVYVDPQMHYLMGNTNSSSAWNPLDYRGLLQVRRSARVAEAYCRRERPDIVHINTTSLMHLAFGARRFGKARIILHVREHWDVRRWDPRDRIRRHVLDTAVDQVVAISETAARKFSDPRNTVVIYDWPSFSGRDRPCDLMETFGIAPGKKVILVPGGRIPIKGSLFAMEAMRRVTNPDAVMLVLGGTGYSTPTKERLRRLLRRLRIETYGLKLDRLASESNGRIMMSGAVQPIRSVIEQSYAVVCPFTTPHFSMPSIEAGALGRPVVISDNGYARETVQDGKTGIIVPPGDVEKLAAALNLLLADASHAADLGRAGRDFVSRQFSEAEWAARLDRVYDS